MKKILVTVAAMIMFFGATAQKEFKLSSIGLSSGQGPLSSGVFIETTLVKGDDYLTVSLGERDLYAVYLKSFFKGKIHIGPCIEYFENVPLVSIMATTNPLKNVSTLSWSGYSAGVPDAEVQLLKWRYLFFYQSVDYTFKRVTTTGAIMWYDGWQPIADLKYTQPINKNISAWISGGYNFYKNGDALLKIGLIYKF